MSKKTLEIRQRLQQKLEQKRLLSTTNHKSYDDENNVKMCINESTTFTSNKFCTATVKCQSLTATTPPEINDPASNKDLEAEQFELSVTPQMKKEMQSSINMVTESIKKQGQEMFQQQAIPWGGKGDDDLFKGASTFEEEDNALIKNWIFEDKFEIAIEKACSILSSRKIRGKYIIIYCKFSSDAQRLVRLAIEECSRIKAGDKILRNYTGLSLLQIICKREGEGGLIRIYRNEKVSLFQIIDGQHESFTQIKADNVQYKFNRKQNELVGLFLNT